MPRIAAATVAEHHAMRRQALLAAGADVLAEQGLDRLTLGEVGTRAGIARSSVYQYFDSTADLVAALVEDAYPRATAFLVEAMRGVDDPAERVHVYLTAGLDLSTQPAFRALPSLLHSDLPEHCLARVRELHAAQAEPLRQALVDLHVPEVEVTSALLGAVLHQAGALLAAGVPRSAVEDRLRAVAAGACHDGASLA